MLNILWSGCDNTPNNTINASIKIDLNQSFEIVWYFRNLNPYKAKTKNKKIGVNIPNSFKRNPETYDPKFPKKFLLSMLDITSQPVSLKLNVKDDKAMKNANVKKIIPKKLRKNFFFKVSSMLLLLYIPNYFF